jgi:hypothetical protein
MHKEIRNEDEKTSLLLKESDKIKMTYTTIIIGNKYNNEC